MIYSSSFKELSLDESTQRFLICTDITNLLSKTGKFLSLTGTIGSAAGAILGYNPKPLLHITAVGALTWFSCHQLYQTLEPQALSIIKNHKISENTNSSTTFIAWFNEELKLLHQTIDDPSRPRWIILNNQMLLKKYNVSLTKENVRNYLDSITNDKEIPYFLITIGLGTEWVCIIHNNNEFKTPFC
jgi:hypothetical protein